jgi:TonB-linked SusC/RagA family outer membrane protein
MIFYTLFGAPLIKRSSFIKTLRIMKLTALLIFLFCLHLSAATYAQITLAENNAPLSKVFRDIRKQSNYQFFYQDELLTNLKKVSVSVNNVSLNQALDISLKDQPLTYTIVGNTVVIKEKEAIPQKNNPALAIIEVTGRVLDEQGQPIPGATVQTKDGKQVTITDVKGYFTLKGVAANAIVVITVIGFQRQEVAAVGNMGDIRMVVANSKLDEVKVIAYGTTTDRLNTGDVSSVSAKEIEEQPVSNPILALEGRVPGMYIVQASGLPGGATQLNVTIRGINSLQNGNYPLYIIDGVPYTSGTLPSGTAGGVMDGTSNPFSFLNPSDIESIDVLKDAGATAIYGSRGANGVVLITTKKGKAGKAQVYFNMQNGFGELGHYMNLLNTSQYLEMRHEAIMNDGAQPTNSDYDLTLWDTTRNTNWQKVLLGGKAKYSDLQGSVSGGNANTQYLIGVGYHKETSPFPGNNFNDQKGSLHVNINSTSENKKFNITLSVNYIIDGNQLGQVDLTPYALALPPDAPPLFNPDGSLNWAPNAQGVSTWPNGVNPLAFLNEQLNLNTYNLVTNSVISYQLLPGLRIKSSFGYTNMQTNGFGDVPFSAIDPSTWPVSQRFSRFTNNNILSWIIEPQINYTKTISKGILTALIGSTIEQNTTTGRVINASGFSSDLLIQDITAATTLTPLSDVNDIYKYNAVFGRLSYNWQDKYLLDLTTRRDGSSRFGPDNRFANFYSVGAGWIFTKENIIQRELPFLSFGKLRASYGTTGNDQIGDYSYLDLYQNIPNVGIPYQGASGIYPTTIYTPNLQWELTRKFETGLDLGFLKDRILLKASFYLNRSSNQLIAAPLPSITGFTSIEENLPAVIQNKGWEFEVNTINVKSANFRWSSSFNFTTNQNILLSAPTNLSAYYQQLVGQQLYSVLVYHELGVNPITGLYEFASSQSGETTNPNPATDMTVRENLQPKFYGGIENCITYKSLSLDFLFQFVKQKEQDYFNSYGGPAGFIDANQPVSVLSRWQQPGDVTNVERFGENGIIATSITNLLQSDADYSDGSFIRLKNLSFSWQLPSSLIKKVKMQGARIFIQGQNLLTFTKYQGLDPESGSGGLPPLRVITFGVQATF